MIAFALAHEVGYTRQEFARMVAAVPWWKPTPIACRECLDHRDLIHVARMQFKGQWLCLEHLLEQGGA